MARLKFSGHESFVCKQSWLQKGLDFVLNEGNFNSGDSVVRLGVGKNMVASIRYWLRSFGLIDENDSPSALAERILGEGGWDPYIEETASIWLMHYQLVKTNHASIYNLFFNHFQVGRHQFSQSQLHRFLVRKCEESGYSISERSLEKDSIVLLKSYLPPTLGKKTDLEEEFARLLIELNLIERNAVKDFGGNTSIVYTVNRSPKPSLPWPVVLYCILDQMGEDERSISFDQIHKMPNSPGIVFSLSEEALLDRIEEMVTHYPEIIYSETAGNKVLQFERPIHKFKVLDAYFNN